MGHGIDAIFRVSLTWDLLGQVCQNVLFFRAKDTTPSDTLFEDVDFILNDVQDWIVSPMLAFMATQVQLIQTDVVVVNPLGGPMNIRVHSGIGGLRGGASMPSYVSAVLSIHTGYSGRRAHGRNYICGVPKDEVEGNVLTAPAVSRLNDVAVSWRNRYREGGTSTRYWGVVYSKKNGVTRDPGPPPVLHYSPLAGIPWRTIDAREQLFTQRHRLAGRGI